MSQRITILVGTMTGTAELVAQELEDSLAAEGVAVEVVPMDDQDAAVFRRDDRFLICTSTYGQGDVPDNAQALYESLESERPDLSAVEYGVIALGDSTYNTTYCQGGRKFDALLSALGARRVGEIMEHDASAGTVPEEVALDWIGGWLETLGVARKAA